MRLIDLVFSYCDIFAGKYDFLHELHNKKRITNSELINANNQFLTDLINCHAKSNLLNKFVSLNSDCFNQNMEQLFGDHELVKEIIKVGSNLSDYFGYCEFCCDSISIAEGFSLVIDKHSLAFSHNDVHSISDLISRNIRFSKAVYVSTKFDPAYQLPTYSLFGVSFFIVPGNTVKYPFIEF